MQLVAHRAGNHPESIAPALSVADAIELDVHLFRGRLEVRHSKVVRPFRVYWERGVGILPDERPVALGDIVAATPDDAHLWIDLKGFTRRLPRRVLDVLGPRPQLTMSCRSWWVLGRVGGNPTIRTFRSVANRAQCWLALRLRHPDGIVMHERFATPDVVARLAPRCRAIAVWAVTDEARAEELRAIGIDAVIADDLDLIAAIGSSG